MSRNWCPRLFASVLLVLCSSSALAQAAPALLTAQPSTPPVPLLSPPPSPSPIRIVAPSIEPGPTRKATSRKRTCSPGITRSKLQAPVRRRPQPRNERQCQRAAFHTPNGFLLDGPESYSAILGIAVINPNLDSLENFKVTTSNYDAEFGSAGGALLQVTAKSGTNQIHGTLFQFLRNSAANAADPSHCRTRLSAGISSVARSARPFVRTAFSFS